MFWNSEYASKFQICILESELIYSFCRLIESVTFKLNCNKKKHQFCYKSSDGDGMRHFLESPF